MPEQEKPIYEGFKRHKWRFLELLEEGKTRREILIELLKKYQVSTHVKHLIGGLGKTPEEQTVEQWLAEYENYNIDETFNKSYRG